MPRGGVENLSVHPRRYPLFFLVFAHRDIFFYVRHGVVGDGSLFGSTFVKRDHERRGHQEVNQASKQTKVGTTSAVLVAVVSDSSLIESGSWHHQPPFLA